MRFSAVPMIYFKPMVLEHTMKLEEWFPIACSLGLDGTEIHDRSMASFEPEYVERIVQTLNDYRLVVSQFIGAADFTNPDPDIRIRELRQMRRNINVAVSLGATCVRATAGQAHPDISHKQGVAWAVDGLRACVEYAHAKGTWIAYENHYKDYFWARPDFSQQSAVFLEILDKLGNTPLKVNFDFGNPVMIDEDPISLLRQLVDRVVHVHCSDRFRGQYQHQIAGNGVVDLPSGFRVLHEAGYNGWLSSEYNGTEGLEGLRQSLNYLHQAWGE